MAEQFDPYRKWLGIPSQDQPPNHYQLLGIPLLENDPDVIENAANRQMAHVRTFQTGKHSKASQQILNELSAAKRCLLVPGKKADYDAQFKKEAATKSGKETPRTALPPTPQVQQAPPPPTPATNQATGVPVQVRSRRSSAARRHRRKQRKSSAIPMLLGIVVTAIVIGLIILAVNRNNRSNTRFNRPPQEEFAQLISEQKSLNLSLVNPL